MAPTPAEPSLQACVAQHAAQRPQHLALICDELELRYIQLDQAARALAAQLRSEGFGGDDALAVCAANSAEYVVLMLAAAWAGLPLALLPLGSPATTLAAMCRDAHARLLYVDPAQQAALAPLGEQLPPQRLLDVSLLQPVLSVPPLGSDPDPNTAFLILYSSGTTGTPKGSVQSQAARAQSRAAAAGLRLDQDAVCLVSTPLYSNTTLACLLPALAVGARVVLMRKFQSEAFLALSERHRVTHAMLVPTQYERLLDSPALACTDLSSYRCKYSTSAPLSALRKAQILQRWPGDFLEIYGMTEGGAICALDARARPDKLHSVGQALPGHELRIIDSEGREVDCGQAGEIVGRSPLTPPLTPATADDTRHWWDAQGRCFLRSGDIGRLDAEGFLTLLDRKKDLIISGGFNIYPADIEAELLAHPEVAEAAVVGLPSQRWGETPVACVVLREHSPLRADVLREWLNARLSKVQRVAHVELMPELPRSGMGKLLKRELRRMLQHVVADQPGPRQLREAKVHR